MDSYTAVASGPVSTRRQALAALDLSGCTMTAFGEHHWGLPSYTDPITAERAGHPNSGHRINETHPSVLGAGRDVDGRQLTVAHDACPHVGKPYEADPGISFITVVCPHPDLVARPLEPLGWALRLHWSYEAPADVPVPQDQTAEIVAGYETRIAALERALASLRTEGA